MRTSSMTGLALLLVVSVALFGCPGEAPEPEADQDSAAPDVNALTLPEPMQAFTDDGNAAEIVIEGDDAMRFDTDRFTVNAGQMVRLTLNHVGNLPAQAMGHNVVILYPDDDVMEFGADVGEHRGGHHDDFVPEALRDRVVAFTAIIGGGETATVEFQVPQDPGEYPFLCSFPGHFAQMNGVMIVE